MGLLESVTATFVKQSREILGENLVGVYLHGSAAMGCLNEKKSDIDLLTVVDMALPDAIKRRYMDMVVGLNADVPGKGVELSVVRKNVCKPFLYPTPFELHFSAAHLQWYKANPSDYIDKMQGIDRDLAAHFMITYHRGKRLCGKEIKDVFEQVDREFYFDSIWNDIKDAEEEIMADPTYMILNLCRVLAYKKDGLILSKQEGGNWGVGNVPGKYHGLILQALDEYVSGQAPAWNEGCAHDYAAYMIGRIRG